MTDSIIKKSDIWECDDRQAIITLSPFTKALSLNCSVDGAKGSEFCLMPVKTSSAFVMRNNQLFVVNGYEQLDDNDIRSLIETDHIDKIDIPMLIAIYTAMLRRFENDRNTWTDNQRIQFYVPDLFRGLGKKANQSDAQVRELLWSITRFGNVLGVETQMTGNKARKVYFSVLNFIDYDSRTKVITLEAPYLEHLVSLIYNASVRTDKKGKPLLSSTGKPKTKAAYSYLVKADIAKERNIAAVENVYNIIRVIEACGTHKTDDGTKIGTPHISAESLVKRNQYMISVLESASRDYKQKYINRVFKKTWELLRNMTELETVYPGIMLPDSNDDSTLPSVRHLDKTIYTFTHHGKIRDPA